MKRFHGAQIGSLLKIHPLLVAVTLLSAAIPASAVTRIDSSVTPQVGGASCCTCNVPGGQSLTEETAFLGDSMHARQQPRDGGQSSTEETAFLGTVAKRGCGGV